MRLLLDDDHDVSRLYTRRLIALSIKRDSLTVLHPAVDMNLEELLLGYRLASRTVLALILPVDDLSQSRTVLARHLHLLDHRAHLSELDAYAPAVTGRALLDGAFFTAAAVALGAEDVAGESELGGLALVQILERDVDAVHQILRLARPALPSTATEEPAAAAAE